MLPYEWTTRRMQAHEAPRCDPPALSGLIVSRSARCSSSSSRASGGTAAARMGRLPLPLPAPGGGAGTSESAFRRRPTTPDSSHAWPPVSTASPASYRAASSLSQSARKRCRDLAASRSAEQVRQAHGTRRGGRASLAQALRTGDDGGHREEIHGDVDDPEEECLPSLEPRAVHEHSVEDDSRQLAARALDEPDVRARAARTSGSVATAPTPAKGAGTRARRSAHRAQRGGAASAAKLARPDRRARRRSRRCLSTASRAMKRCMISLEPSKMRLIRESRIIRSMPIGTSPRAASDRSVS